MPEDQGLSFQIWATGFGTGVDCLRLPTRQSICLRAYGDFTSQTITITRPVGISAQLLTTTDLVHICFSLVVDTTSDSSVWTTAARRVSRSRVTSVPPSKAVSHTLLSRVSRAVDASYMPQSGSIYCACARRLCTPALHYIGLSRAWMQVDRSFDIRQG